MFPHNHILEGKDVPTICFQCMPRQDDALELVVLWASKGAHALLQNEERLPLEGKTARELFLNDWLMVDGWMEFLLRVRKNPKARIYDSRDKHKLARRGLQFLQLFKGWAEVDIEYDLKEETAVVCFLKPKDAVMKIGVRHLMDLRQTLWLRDYVDDGGDWEIDLVGRTIYLSRWMARRMHLAQDAAIVPLERYFERIPAEDLVQMVAAIQNVESLDSQMALRLIENRVLREDGKVLHFSSYGIPGYNEEGEMTRIFGQTRDVTEQKNAVQQLAVSEERFRGIVENSQDVFVTLQPDGHINYVSPNVKTLLGYTPGRVVGSKFQKYVAFKEERRQLASDFDKVLAGGFSEGEFLLKKADGNMVWMLIRMSAIAGSEGGAKEVVAVCRDITEEKRHKENLEYMSAHDALTEVYNRFYFERELEKLEEQGEVGVGLVLTDLNGLKLVNDAYGHSRGDELLREAVLLLREVCGPEEKLFRVGGDEFAVFMYGCRLEELEQLCARIDKQCEKTRTRDIPVSLSWGMAWREDTEQSMQELYNQAEGSMYSNKLLDSRSMRSHVLSSLKETLKMRNLETADHTQRMENMVMALGKRLGLPAAEFDRLALLASMHDIGKVAIPDKVINKPGRLTRKEWEIMRTHSEIGARIAETSQELAVVAEEISCHHERWDGAGYPLGKKEEEIPLLARIISVVDSYDVMTHKRVYKDAIPHEDAIAELERCSGSQFDPQIVELFLDIFGSMSGRQMREFINGDEVWEPVHPEKQKKRADEEDDA